MLHGFREKAPRTVADVAEMRLEESGYPFPFPVIVVHDDTFCVGATPRSVGTTDEDSATTGLVPAMAVYAGDGHVWRPTAVTSFARSGTKLFGKNVVHARYAFDGGRPFDLDDLRAVVRTFVENDPDDLYDQFMEHVDLLLAIKRARTFEELVAVLQPSDTVPPEKS